MDSDIPHSRSIALIVLAAGAGRRFGPRDKLAADLGGRAVAHHALERLGGIDFGQRILVNRGPAPWEDAFAQAGFAIHRNPTPDTGMVGSLHVAAGAVRGMTHVLIALADMPRVSSAHLAALVACSQQNPGRIVASVAEGYLGPPAILPVADLARLPLSGDAGARHLLGSALHVATDRVDLADMDTPEDLAWLRRG